MAKKEVVYFDNDSIPALFVKNGEKVSYEILLPNQEKPVQAHLDKKTFIELNPVFIDKYTKREYFLSEIIKWRITSAF